LERDQSGGEPEILFPSENRSALRLRSSAIRNHVKYVNIMNANAISASNSIAVYKFACAIVMAVSLIGPPEVRAQTMMQRQYLNRHEPAQNPSLACGDFNYASGSIGPLDYRATPKDVIEFVETRHFTPDIERLVKGRTGTLGAEIAYTLRAFPNHPRALKSAAALTRRNGGQMPRDMNFGITCWFDRAVAFRPDDIQVRILWAFELLKSKETVAARDQTQVAEKLAGGSPVAHYNVGLLYFELGDYEKALTNAKIAYDGGFNLPGLKDKLSKAGQWNQ